MPLISDTYSTIAGVQGSNQFIAGGTDGTFVGNYSDSIKMSLTSISGSALGIGQALMSASIPVAIASNQSEIPVSQSGIWTIQQGTPPWTIQGDSPSGVAATGNPIQIGGVFNTTQPTVTTGQSISYQSTSRGALIVATGIDNFNINNISGTVSLPTGASTANNQTAVQGSASGGSPAVNSGLIGGIYNSTSPSLTSGQQASVQLDISARVLTKDTIDNSLSSGTVTVSTSAVAARVGTSNLTNRKMLTISPQTGTVYLGASSSVTTSTGIPIFQNQVISFAFSANITPYLIAASSITVSIMEGS